MLQEHFQSAIKMQKFQTVKLLEHSYFEESYEEPRHELFNGLNEISPHSVISDLSNELLVEFSLFGNERLPPDVNKRLIEATLKFIHATKRF